MQKTLGVQGSTPAMSPATPSKIDYAGIREYFFDICGRGEVYRIELSGKDDEERRQEISSFEKRSVETHWDEIYKIVNRFGGEVIRGEVIETSSVFKDLKNCEVDFRVDSNYPLLTMRLCSSFWEKDEFSVMIAVNIRENKNGKLFNRYSRYANFDYVEEMTRGQELFDWVKDKCLDDKGFKYSVFPNRSLEMDLSVFIRTEEDAAEFKLRFPEITLQKPKFRYRKRKER